MKLGRSLWRPRRSQSHATRTADRSEWEVVFPAGEFTRLMDHLFPGDGDEHGAIVLAGLVSHRGRLRLLAREVLLAEDGVDYVPGERGYRALHPLFVSKGIRRARELKLAYLAVHCHGGLDSVSFSQTDVASHERGYPALTDISGAPVGALVFARKAVAGDLFFPDGGRARNVSAIVVGRNIERLQSAPVARTGPPAGSSRYDRQARIFGEVGQQLLGRTRVGIVGAGGAGMFAVHLLARLGVGSMVIVDPDRIDVTNLPRLPGVPASDAMPWAEARFLPGPVRSWAYSRRRYKVDRAERIVLQANGAADVIPLRMSADAPTAVAALRECDAIFLAADSQLARHVVNAISHAYLIPTFQVGVKVPVAADSGAVGDIFVVSRRVNPDSGCLWCNGLIDATALQLEAMGEEGERAAAYVNEPTVVAPSVITLNGIAVSQAVTDFMFAFTGLNSDTRETHDSDPVAYVRFMPRRQVMSLDLPRREPSCMHCSSNDSSLFAMGDAAVLPIAHAQQLETGTRRRR